MVEAMRGTEIYVARSALPPPKPDEYYWWTWKAWT